MRIKKAASDEARVIDLNGSWTVARSSELKTSPRRSSGDLFQDRGFPGGARRGGPVLPAAPVRGASKIVEPGQSFHDSRKQIRRLQAAGAGRRVCPDFGMPPESEPELPVDGRLGLMGKTIMTVDDSASMRQMVGFTLKQAGIRRHRGRGRQGRALQNERRTDSHGPDRSQYAQSGRHRADPQRPGESDP